MAAYTKYNLTFVDAKNKIHNDWPIYNKNHMAINRCRNLTLLEHMGVVCMGKSPTDGLYMEHRVNKNANIDYYIQNRRKTLTNPQNHNNTFEQPPSN